MCCGERPVCRGFLFSGVGGVSFFVGREKGGWGWRWVMFENESFIDKSQRDLSFIKLGFSILAFFQELELIRKGCA